MIAFILQIIYSCVCFIFINQLYQLFIQYWQKDKILLYRVSNTDIIRDPKLAIVFGLFIVVPIIDYKFLTVESDMSNYFTIFILNVFFPLLCFPDINDVLESSKLNFGYLAALWYYKNYLTLILPNDFLERVRTFESINKVQVEKKLYILVPESCVVQQYLDNDEADGIERCQELPKSEITNSGFKKRVYNITVYLLRNKYEKKRIAIEYAQPLKGLFTFKEKKFFTEEEMFHHRQSFVESLQELLKDGKGLFKFCEIVQFNDKKRKVLDVLLHHNQFENSVNDIV